MILAAFPARRPGGGGIEHCKYSLRRRKRSMARSSRSALPARRRARAPWGWRRSRWPRPPGRSRAGPPADPAPPAAPSVEIEGLVGSPPGEPDAHRRPVRRRRQQEGAARARTPHGDRHLGGAALGEDLVEGGRQSMVPEISRDVHAEGERLEETQPPLGVVVIEDPEIEVIVDLV